MDKKYWENYYSSHTAPEQPSLFARFVLDTEIKEGSSLIELGCGNGRDCLYFARHNIHVLAIDQSETEIAELRTANTLPNLRLESADFTSLGDIGTFDYVYSRWTLHSIKAHEEDRVIAWAQKHLPPGGKFLIEARGKKNEIYKMGVPVEGEPDAYIFNDHYRRFIDINVLTEKLKQAGFEITLATEETGFSPFKDTDYHFMRVIAVKK
jgi:tellurite methyltransferase